MKLSDKQLYVLLGVGAVGLLIARNAAAEAAEAVNPLNNDNIFASFSNGVTQALTGRKLDKFGNDLTLGGWLGGG
jgi:hypothetical protein